MRIGIVRYRGKSLRCVDPAGLLGASSIAHICDDQVFFNHVDGEGKEFDVTILIGTPQMVEWYKTRKPKWGKVLFMFYKASLELNNLKEIPSIDLFDGILTTQKNTKSWDIFGKPVIDTFLPYIPESFDAEKKEKAVVIIKHLEDKNVNFIDTLSVFKKTGMKGIVSTNCAFPYSEDTEKLNGLVKKLNLDLEVNRPKNRQEYMESISDCSVMLTMDSRQSYGRWVVDAATLGIPCIGTYSTMQEILYPEYMVYPNEIDKAVELVKTAKPKNIDWSLFEPHQVRKALEGKIEANFGRI